MPFVIYAVVIFLVANFLFGRSRHYRRRGDRLNGLIQGVLAWGLVLLCILALIALLVGGRL